MPKASSLSKSSKKKKYNARFPPARIKKIMQTDEEVGKVAAAVPVIISRSLELFIESLVTETAKLTRAKNAKTLSTSHIKQTIKATNQFDFLRDLVKNVPDHQAEDNGDSAHDGEPSIKRGKGRPRKSDASTLGRKRKAGGNKTSSEEDDDEDEEDDEDEATDTDEELTSRTVSSCPTDSSTSQIVPGVNSNQSHNPLHPSLSAMSHNNNYVPTEPVAQMSVLRDTLISDKNMAQVLHHQSLPLSSNCDPQSALLHPQLKQPLYQMSSNFSPYLPSKGSFPVNSVYPANSITQTLLQQQQQPIDLTKPLQQNCVNEDDDYDT